MRPFVSRRSAIAPTATIAIALLMAGCGAGSTSTSSPSPTPTSSYTVPPGGQRTGDVPTKPQSGQTFSLQAKSGSNNGIDMTAYDESMDFALGAINEYWIETMPKDFNQQWAEPSQFVAYYPPEDTGPTCQGQAGVPENAVYCDQGNKDFIAWDEPGFMLPIYASKGDMGAAVILAHEFGHGAQAKLGTFNKFKHSIEAELQADCFAGAWAAWADQQQLLGEDAAKQAADTVLSVGDAEGTAWNAPDAHGTGPQRLEAFTKGTASGATGCATDYAPGFTER